MVTPHLGNQGWTLGREMDFQRLAQVRDTNGGVVTGDDLFIWMTGLIWLGGIPVLTLVNDGFISFFLKFFFFNEFP